jgi:hypothetical protein
MADVTFTAAAIKPGTNAQTVEGTFGATITQGMVVYLDSGTGTYKIADCTTSTATAAAVGIALTSGASGQPGVVMTGGNLTCDGVTAYVQYVLSVSGKIAPSTDYASSTDYLTVIGAATTTTNIKLAINVTGVGKTG